MTNRLRRHYTGCDLKTVNSDSGVYCTFIRRVYVYRFITQTPSNIASAQAKFVLCTSTRAIKLEHLTGSIPSQPLCPTVGFLPVASDTFHSPGSHQTR